MWRGPGANKKILDGHFEGVVGSTSQLLFFFCPPSSSALLFTPPPTHHPPRSPAPLFSVPTSAPRPTLLFFMDSWLSTPCSSLVDHSSWSIRGVPQLTQWCPKRLLCALTFHMNHSIQCTPILHCQARCQLQLYGIGTVIWDRQRERERTCLPSLVSIAITLGE